VVLSEIIFTNVKLLSLVYLEAVYVLTEPYLHFFCFFLCRIKYNRCEYVIDTKYIYSEIANLQVVNAEVMFLNLCLKF
jgi:hypothetical protein